MTEKRMKYKDLTEKARKAYENLSPEMKAAIKKRFLAEGFMFAQMWDILKAIEKKYDISVMDIAKDIRWKQAYEAGQKAAKNYEKNGLKELYQATSAQYEAICDVEWFEFNDNRIEKHCRRCPMEEVFREMGRTPEEMEEWAPLFCLADTAFWSGFNPEFEVFSLPRLLMRGDPHCTYVAIHHWEKMES